MVLTVQLVSWSSWQEQQASYTGELPAVTGGKALKSTASLGDAALHPLEETKAQKLQSTRLRYRVYNPSLNNTNE